MREENIISNILKNFQRSPRQVNQPFACDAEIVEIAGQLWGVTVDEFSAAEDMFGEMFPSDLGRNLATATISDLFACGAQPEFFLQTVILGDDADEKYVSDLSGGVSEALDEAGCFLLGGDLGRAPTWRYTGVAMGKIESDSYLSRILPPRLQALWVTGDLGDANYAAFTQSAAPLFELRVEEARYIRQNATGCIDTSGGFLDAAWMLKTLNPDLRFEIEASSLPINCAAVEFCRSRNLPPQALLCGGAGEYELLFATDVNADPTVPAARIGTVTTSGPAGLFYGGEDKTVEITQPPLCPREIGDRDQYIQALLKQAVDLFG